MLKVKVGDKEKLAYIQIEAWKKGFKESLPKEILGKYKKVIR